MKLLLKNSQGKDSLSFTMVYTSFAATLLWFILNIFSTPHIRAFDVTIATGFLTPLLALYFGRRWNENQVQKNTSATTATTEPSSSSAD